MSPVNGSIVTDRDLRRWAIQSDADEVYVWLIKIEHPSLTEAIRISSNPSEFIALHEETREPVYGTRHNGEIYYCIPFAFIVPNQPEGNDIPRATIRVDNVDREMIKTIRETSSAPICAVTLVFNSTPDIVRDVFPKLRLTGVTYTATSIEGRLSPYDFRAEPVPALNFLPSSNPGMFV